MMKKKFSKDQLEQCKNLRLAGNDLQTIADIIGTDETTVFAMHLELMKKNELYYTATLDEKNNPTISWHEGKPTEKKNPFGKLSNIFTKQKSNHGHNMQADRGAGNETT